MQWVPSLGMTWDDVRTPEGGETSETDSRWRGKRVAVHTRTAPACLDARSPYSRRLYALGTDGLDASKTGNRRRVPKGVYYNVHNRGQGARSPYYEAYKPSGAADRARGRIIIIPLSLIHI